MPLDYTALHEDLIRLEHLGERSPQVLRCGTCDAMRLVTHNEFWQLEVLWWFRRNPKTRAVTPSPSGPHLQWGIEAYHRNGTVPSLVCPDCLLEQPIDLDEEEFDEAEWARWMLRREAAYDYVFGFTR